MRKLKSEQEFIGCTEYICGSLQVIWSVVKSSLWGDEYNPSYLYDQAQRNHELFKEQFEPEITGDDFDQGYSV